MVKQLKRLYKNLTQKRFQTSDIFWIMLIIFGVFILSRYYEQYDSKLSTDLAVQTPWLVKYDSQGNSYVVDDEKARILKIVKGEITQTINGDMRSNDTFYYAENICIAENGDIYIQDTGWSKTGFSIDYERILRYDAKGTLLGTCYQVNYNDIYCDKHRLFGMDIKGNYLYFVTADEVGFSLKEMNLVDNQVNTLSSYNMKDAITLIQDFVIDTDNLNIYAIDKRGKLFCGELSDNLVTTLYEWDEDSLNHSEQGKKMALYRGAIGEEGELYITDIASNRLLKFSRDTNYRPKTILEGSKMWNVSYQECYDGKKILSYVADQKICTANLDGTDITKNAQYKKAAIYGIKEGLYDIAAILTAISLFYLTMRVMAIIFTMSYTNTQKVGVLVISTVIVVSVILVYGLIGQFQNIYRDELLTKLSMGAQIVSNSVNEEQLNEIDMPKNYMNENYQKMWNTMNGVLDRDYEYSEDIYCNILRYDGTSGYAVIYLDNSIGTYYPLTEDETTMVKKVYETGISLQSDIDSETGSYIYVMSPVFGENNEVVGVISVGTLSSVIEGKITDMIKDVVIAMIMIILVIMFLFSEVLSFFDLKDRYKLGIANREAVIPMHIVRFVIFITFMAFNMATSFLPVYIIRFVHEGMGIPTALANSLPITLNLIFIGLTSVFCPKLINRLGFAKLATLSGVIALCGDLLMASCVNYGMILAGLVLNGIGVGIITNSIHIFIASISKQDKNENGFSIFNAASLSGINCGMLFGSALAQRLGQNRVFFVSATAWALVTVVFLVVGKRFVMAKSKQVEDGIKKQNMFSFITSPNVLRFMICIQVPYIIINSFTYYYVPIYGSEHGLTENITSLLIIVCSLCSVYLSVTVTNYLSRKFKDKAMYLSSIITFAGLLFFAWSMSLFSLVVALLLIGLANSFGSSTRISYFIKMKESIRYGEENAMGTYDFIDNLGESTGSVIFAGIISIGFRGGILGLIGCVGGLNAIYALTARNAGKDIS